MDGDFLGLDLRPVELPDRERIGGLLARHPQPLSDYVFSSLLVWAPVMDHRFSVPARDTLLLAGRLGCDPQPCLLQPVGDFPEGMQGELLERAARLPSPLRIVSVCGGFIERHESFVRHFDVHACRDRANYVYEARSLAELAGRKLAGKRNQIAQASRDYSWDVADLGPGLVDGCLLVVDDIAEQRNKEMTASLAEETHALQRALRMLEPLGLRGLVVLVDGKPAAFSVFDRLGPDTAVVLFERALRGRKGLYQVVNRETARVLAREGVRFANREEDLGDPGLRQAKESYLPARLEPSFVLTLKR